MKKALRSIAESINRARPEACFSIELWDGDQISFGRPNIRLILRNKQCLKRIMRDGFFGLGESYMSGDLDIKGDILELCRLGISIDFASIRPSPATRIKLLIFYLLTPNSKLRSPRNISRHYDLGNDFYSLFLDESMTYSSAYFKNGTETLAEAQKAKYEHIARKLGLEPGQSLADIGCGWGGMLFHAAENYGVRATGVTLSKEQYAYAKEEIGKRGLKDRVRVLYQDYRDLEGEFDRIVSVGMFEHVGRRYIGTFMKKMSGLLRKGGLGLLHSIGKDRPTATDPWITKYIFPGGYLPCLDEIVGGLGRAGFSILDVENLRGHYVRTLKLWAGNFEKNAETVREMFGEPFVRRWRLFLGASAAGFMEGDTRLYQVLFSNGLNNDLPMTREYIYNASS
jgi:cyclopropane-fatty-acyl-phospholipid synthase